MGNESHVVKKIKFKVHPKTFTISATSFNCSSLFQKMSAKFSVPNTSATAPFVIKISRISFTKKLKKEELHTVNTAKTIGNRLIIFSLSFFKTKYPHNWKNIFAHFSEKTNLLLRSDNNTGFPIWKSLQTTTI